MARRSRFASPTDRANGCASCSRPVTKASRVVDGAIGDVVHLTCLEEYRDVLSFPGEVSASAFSPAAAFSISAGR